MEICAVVIISVIPMTEKQCKIVMDLDLTDDQRKWAEEHCEEIKNKVTSLAIEGSSKCTQADDSKIGLLDRLVAGAKESVDLRPRRCVEHEE